MWEASDEALLAGMGTGDGAAAIAFVRRFQRRVHGLALLITGDDTVAEDVAQEAFVRAWRHAPAFDPRRGSVTTWLLTITRNLAIDALRVARARPADPVDVIEVTADGPLVEPSDHAVHRDEVTRVAAAVASLPVEQRRAVVLASLYGRSAREVSEVEGVPLGTAKTRIRTGLIRLREALGADQRRGPHR